MANVLVQESSLQDIADAIRTKNGTQNTYKPAQMANAIEAISGGGITPTGTINITANGIHDVTNYASADVNVPQSGITPTGTIQITANGTVDVTNYASAEVNVPTGGASEDIAFYFDAQCPNSLWQLTMPITNVLSDGGYIEITVDEPSPSNDYSNIIGIGEGVTATSTWQSDKAIIFYHQKSGDNDRIVTRFGTDATYSDNYDSSTIIAKIVIDAEYITVNNQQVMGTPSYITTLSSLYIAANQGSKRCNGRVSIKMVEGGE